MKKCVPGRSPRRCPPYFLIITAFNYFPTTSCCFILLLTKFEIFGTTRLLLLYYSVPIVFAMFQHVVAVFVLLLYYMLTNVYYLLLHDYYFFTTCLLLCICLLRLNIFYTSLLLLTTFEYVVQRLNMFVYLFTVRLRLWYSYPVVVITWVHDLGPPGPSTSQILGTFSRFSETFLAERQGVPTLRI